MTIRCLGWTQPQHPPVVLAEVAPLEDKRTSDGMCPACEAAVNAEIEAQRLSEDC